MTGERFTLEDFKSVPGQIGPRGARVLFALQDAIANWTSGYSYIEIGSYAGRSLHPHIRLPECKRALSIDLRPDVAHDERGPIRGYNKVTVDNMTANLRAQCSEDDLAKLETITGTSDELRDRDLQGQFDLAFIDGEHTVRGSFTDFLNIIGTMKDDAIIAFDDLGIVYPAIEAASAYLTQRGIKHKFVYLRNSMAFVQLGKYADLEVAVPRRLVIDAIAARENYLNQIRKRHDPS